MRRVISVFSILNILNRVLMTIDTHYGSGYSKKAFLAKKYSFGWVGLFRGESG
jgi:hypothetical protein